MVAPEMDPAHPGAEEKSEGNKKSSGNATQKRTELTILHGGKGQPDKSQAGHAGGVERAERTGRAAKGSLNRRYFCSNKGCEYYEITDERIHALVGDGSYGTHEEIQDLKCQ
jgi:hypothetical protein